MAQCRLCAGFEVARWIPDYESANGEYPDRSTRYPHHSSFEDLEQAAAVGCDLCGLIVKIFKSVDGRDEHSWDWPKELLEQQSEGYVSVYRLVKMLPGSTHTKVQIYINTSRLYGANTKGEPPVLDLVMVHVGPHLKHKREVPTLKLKLRTVCPPGNQVMQFWGHRIGSLPFDPYTGSDRNFKLAKQWLSTCKNHHGNCLSRHVPSLPTRVINVGDKPGYQDVHLEVPKRGLKGEYVALSHCWGGDIELKLGMKNLEDFKGRIPFDDLSANFKDAIKVTRELGIRYLWIDSLCILQGEGSKADWEQESKKMTTVYRDSTLTVSAMSSKKSKDGFLVYEPNNGGAVDQESVRVNFLPDFMGMDVEATVGRFDPRQEEVLYDLEHDPEKKGPLARRGWTLQENVLSPRLLYYGANMIHWTCPSERQSANGMRGMHMDDKKYPAVSSVIFRGILKRQTQDPDYDVQDILLDYYGLVDSYSARQLTKPSDRFPAFSGIVRPLQPVLGDYLAGLWSCDIVRGLWWVKEKGGGPVEEYRAPSWSWASVDGPVSCWQCPGEKGRLDVQVLDHTIRLADPSNPFGPVRGGSLTLRGRTMRLRSPLEYSENPGEGIEDLFDVVIDESRQDATSHKSPNWSRTSGVSLPGSSSREQNESNSGIDQPSWIKLGGNFIIPGLYVVLLLRTRRNKGYTRLQIWCLLLESVHGLRHEVFKRAGTLEGYSSLAVLKKWQQETVTIR